jgi:hypothetical protein
MNGLFAARRHAWSLDLGDDTHPAIFPAVWIDSLLAPSHSH